MNNITKVMKRQQYKLIQLNAAKVATAHLVDTFRLLTEDFSDDTSLHELPQLVEQILERITIIRERVEEEIRSEIMRSAALTEHDALKTEHDSHE